MKIRDLFKSKKEDKVPPEQNKDNIIEIDFSPRNEIVENLDEISEAIHTKKIDVTNMVLTFIYQNKEGDKEEKIHRISVNVFGDKIYAKGLLVESIKYID